LPFGHRVVRIDAAVYKTMKPYNDTTTKTRGRKKRLSWKVLPTGVFSFLGDRLWL
jgi:hypothetical protein